MLVNSVNLLLALDVSYKGVCVSFLGDDVSFSGRIFSYTHTDVK